MLFSFSFKFSVPGLTNPFSSYYTESGSEKNFQHVAEMTSSIQAYDDRRPPPTSISPTPPLCKKRGWVPSSSELSLATTSPASTSGFLDTPAKYREIAASKRDQGDEMIVDLPPAKRRRGLTGSIVSTAFSAALIGAAVGLTVYRIWSSRGKERESTPSPPPPYEEEWVHADRMNRPSSPASVPKTPVRNRKARIAGTAGRRSVGRHRRTRTRPQISVPKINSQPEPHFDFSRTEEGENGEAEVEDEIDWIGDKLSKLIAEGKRALGTEIVVMSEAKEDETDDGAGGWEEDNTPGSSSFSSRRSSRRMGASPGNIPIPSSSDPVYIRNASASRRLSSTSNNSASGSFVSPLSSPRTPGRWKPERASYGLESPSFLSAVTKENENDWQSNELRESMERARAALLQRRMTTGGTGTGEQ